MNDNVSGALSDIFPGDSAMAREMRTHDWTATPLGAPEGWPDGLKIPLRMLLTSRFEMWLGWGPDLCFFYNDAYIPTLGLKHPAMLGRPFREVWAEVYGDVADQVERVRAGEATWNKSLLLLLERNGYPEETYHSFSYSPLHGDGGAVEGMLCVVSEETEAVIAARRLDMLRALGMRLVGTLDDAAVREAVCAVLSANRRDFPFALIHVAEGGGRAGHACTHDAAHLLAEAWPLAEIEAGGAPLRLPLPAGLRCPTGDWAIPPAEAIAVAIPGPTGEPPFGSLILGLNPHRRGDDAILSFASLVAGQISGALANVRALQAERRRADRIWAHSRDLMVVLGADGIFRSVSPAWTRILGHAVEDVVGHHFEEFLIADDLPSTQGAIDRAANDADLTGFENRFRSRDGGHRRISWHTAMEGGLIYGYGRDVTEQKIAAEALERTADALRQSQKMEAVGQLTGGIAHDFNNLLTGIIGSLEMMQRKAAQGRTADVERYVAAATTSANRAAALTQRLLAFARRQALDPRTVDANRLVRDMEDLIRRSIGEAITFEMVTAVGLWTTRCDPNQLESAILNLAINARDAMAEGGRLTIETGNATIDAAYVERHRYAAAGQYVTVSVTDTGTGMAPDVIAKAFEPFFTTKPIGQGTGLGLSMVYGFTRQSNGFVNIYSEVGQGTTVRLYLPRDTAAVVEPVAEEAVEEVVRASGCVLVVEDEAAVRGLAVDLLAELGCRTIEAVDGPSAVAILQSDVAIDLLVTDVGLPGLNGRQVADAGRAVRPDLKILIMTGYAHNAAVGNGLLDPGMEIITKPFALDKFAGRVRALIGG